MIGWFRHDCRDPVVVLGERHLRHTLLLSVAVAEAVTGCVMRAIPPVAFDDQLTVVADETFLATESEIAFNAGRLDRSIVIDTADYKRIVVPRIKQIAVG
jgi:Ala-tRNA(Pro) deacylase